jgi:uncharacterized peroxidase-related enzyme
VKKDYRRAKLDPKTRALCDCAVKLTRYPERAAEADILALRAAGCTDEEIHDATQVIALFNYYTRLAHGLGVEPEDFMPRKAAATKPRKNYSDGTARKRTKKR